MDRGTSPFPSYGALARAALAHPEWPRPLASKPSSLASLLSKLDRRLELEWLRDRPEVQTVLSEVLQLDGCELLDAVAGPVAEPPQRLALLDLPLARPLDLRRDPLPPGVPARVLDPQSWRRLWWQAPGGGGKSLCARWLEARGLASIFHSFRDLTVAPLRGPAFVDLSDAHAMWTELPSQLTQLCVASRHPPPSGGGFESIASPPLESTRQACVAWLAARLPNFDAEAARRVLDHCARNPDLAGLGTALSLAGADAPIQRALVDGASPRKLCELFVEQQKSRVWCEPDEMWLRERMLDTAVALAINAMLQQQVEDLPWNAPRSAQAWADLVPRELARALEVHSLQAKLGAAGGMALTDVERALVRGPQAAERAIVGLQALGLLRSDGTNDSLRVAPTWFARHLRVLALESLFDAPPARWGEALLRPELAPELADALQARLGSGLDVWSALFEWRAERSPPYVAAIEMSFRVAGRLALEGVELDEANLKRLWQRQAELWLASPEREPRPRLPFADALPPLDDGSWQLAALAISARLGGVALQQYLGCWPQPETPTARRVLDHIFRCTACGKQQGSRFSAAAYRCVAEHPWTANARGFPPHALQLPRRLLEGIANRQLTWSLVVRIEPESGQLDALREMVRDAGCAWSDAVHALWCAWLDALGPEPDADRHLAPVLAPDTAWAPELYAYAPRRALEKLLALRPELLPRLPWQWLGDDAWEGTLSALRSEPHVASLSAAVDWTALPRHVAERALKTGAFPIEAPRATACLWERFVDLAADLLERAFNTRDEALACTLLRNTPSQRADLVVELMYRRVESEKPLPPCTFDWLHAQVASRSPGWRSAFVLLDRLTPRASRPSS